MYSLKKALLTEEIVSQRNFVSRLIDLMKKKPKIMGAFSFGSYDLALDYVTDIDDDEDEDEEEQLKTVEVDGLKMSSEDAKSYEEMKKEFADKEDRRLKTLEIKKKKGIKTSVSDETPITFNAGIFFKRSKEQKLLANQEMSICLEIIKVDSVLGLSSIKDKKSALKAEAVMTKQIARFLNIDGTPVNFKAIMPLYDKMIEYIEKKSDVNVNSCILAADLYIKELYSTASPFERREIDGGNFDFSVVFTRSNYFIRYNKMFSQDTAPVIDLYEDQDVKIVYPTSIAAFNKEISSKNIEGGLTWCTQNIGSWQSHHKNHFVAILYDKRVANDDKDNNFIISLKINYSVDDPRDLIDYYETCDRYNDHMNQKSVLSVISYDVIETLTYTVRQKLKYFEPRFIKKNLDEIPDVLSSLAKSGRFDLAKEIILKSATFSPIYETVNLVKLSLTNTSDESERRFLRIVFDVAADCVLYGSRVIAERLLDYDLLYEDTVSNLNSSEFYNILISTMLEPRVHPKYFMCIFKCLDKEKLKTFVNKEEIIESCKIAFSTNNSVNFKTAADNLVDFNTSTLEILKKENAVEELFEIIVSSKGFANYIKNESLYATFKEIIIKEIKNQKNNNSFISSSDETDVISDNYSNIEYFLSDVILGQKEYALNILEKYDCLQILNSVDQTLMMEYIKFNVESSIKGILTLLDEDEVRSNSAYTNQFDGIFLSKKDFENVMLNILTDKEVLNKANDKKNVLYDYLLEKSIRPINNFGQTDNKSTDYENIVKFLIENNDELSESKISLCISGFDKLTVIYNDLDSMPRYLLQGIIDYIKTSVAKMPGIPWSFAELIKKSCFNTMKKCDLKSLKMTADLINLMQEDELVAESMFETTGGVGGWGGINKSEVDIVQHNYMNFLFHIADQTKSLLSKKINDLCGKSLNTKGRLDPLDVENLKRARIVVMKGAERYLSIEKEVYSNIVNNTKRPMNPQEVLLNLYILGSKNVDLDVVFNAKKISETFQSFTGAINASSGTNNVYQLTKILEMCTISFTDNSSARNKKVNRFYTRELIEAISEKYEDIMTNYDQKEQRDLDRFIVALIENYINFNIEGLSEGDAFTSIKSILERANKSSGHIFYSQKFSPVVRKAIENIPRDISGSSGNYYQEISRLYSMQDEDPARDNSTDSEVQTESALRNYIRMLLS